MSAPQCLKRHAQVIVDTPDKGELDGCPQRLHAVEVHAEALAEPPHFSLAESHEARKPLGPYDRILVEQVECRVLAVLLYGESPRVPAPAGLLPHMLKREPHLVILVPTYDYNAI